MEKKMIKLINIKISSKEGVFGFCELGAQLRVLLLQVAHLARVGCQHVNHALLAARQLVYMSGCGAFAHQLGVGGGRGHCVVFVASAAPVAAFWKIRQGWALFREVCVDRAPRPLRERTLADLRT